MKLQRSEVQQSKVAADSSYKPGQKYPGKRHVKDSPTSDQEPIRVVDYLTRNRTGGAESVVGVVDQGAVGLVKAISKQWVGTRTMNHRVPLCNRNNKSFRPSRIGSGVGRFRPVVGT